MKRIAFFVLGLVIVTVCCPTSVQSAKPPYPIMYGVNIGTDVSTENFLNDLTSINPMYIFNNPYYEKSQLSAQRIKDIHARLPQTKVILHLVCCNLFDQKKFTSGNYAQVTFSNQNSQSEFDNAWENHQDAFMKNLNGGYIYSVIEKIPGMWLDPGIAYLMDPDSTYFQNVLYKKFKEWVTAGGYDGIYLDLMVPGFFVTHYNSRPAVDNHLLTIDEGRDKLIHLNQALQNKRNNDPDPKVRKALIFTNSVGGTATQYYDLNYLVDYNRNLQTQGVQIENPFQNFTQMTKDEWLTTVNLIKEITKLQNSSMKGWLNYHITEGMANQKQCDRQSLYVFSSYLLANQSPDFAFLFLCKFSGNRIYPSNTLARIRLGNPSAQYQELSSGLFVREYEKGFALVNPTKEQKGWQSELILKNAYSTTTYPKNTNIVLPAHTGLVLLKETSIAASPTPPTGNPADLTDEGDTPGNQVNEFDYNALVENFGKTGPPGWIKADIIKNGKVDEFDYNALVEDFGR